MMYGGVMRSDRPRYPYIPGVFWRAGLDSPLRMFQWQAINDLPAEAGVSCNKLGYYTATEPYMVFAEGATELLDPEKGPAAVAAAYA